MKRHYLFPIAAIPGIVALSWTALAGPGPRVALSQSKNAEAPSAVDREAGVLRMEAEQSRIATRLGMSAPMEVVDTGGSDPVDDLIKSGVIIEVTLEEVESALTAAAVATADTKDDHRALDLKHRGSYRFFAP